MRRLFLATVALVAAVAVFLLATLPPVPQVLPVDGVGADLVARTVAGAYHIHTDRSDGASGRAEVAAAAARAGLGFAIFTDHGDGTVAPDPPQYLSGVLCIDGVEISTNGGHYVAVGMGPAPYPLGGEAAAVVEDVRRLGGFGVAAHPYHPRPDLTWQDWDAPIDALEWINADAEWRTESLPRLIRVVFDYLIRPGPALASVFDRPEGTLRRWDTLAAGRHVVGLAAVDAHGRGLRRTVEGSRVVPGPGYVASFRSVTNRVILTRRLSGAAATDADLLLEALRAGRVYSVVDAIGGPVYLDVGRDGVVLSSRLPTGAEITSRVVGSRTRLEISAPDAPGKPPVPWVVTNHWGGPPPAPSAAPPVDPAADPLRLANWHAENDQSSTARTLSDPDGAALQYELGPTPRANQFAALAGDLAPGLERPVRGLTFRASAVKPMRVSVQLRFPPHDDRWVKSVYLDADEREVSIETSAMIAADRSGAAAPDTAPRSLLFVVDLVNARPGDTGSFTIRDIRAR